MIRSGEQPNAVDRAYLSRSTRSEARATGKRVLHTDERREQFERLVLPNLRSAYNLARWITGNTEDAEDVAQDACLRAFRAIDRFRGGDPRAWLLAIVRNAAHTCLAKRTGARLPDYTSGHDRISDPEFELLRAVDTAAVRAAIEKIPGDFRDALVLREMEQLSYKEIAEVLEIPIGTVMSKIARARRLLRDRLLITLEENE
jgi:RNA polymerase sigma-70 factor (ECF subfamily)